MAAAQFDLSILTPERAVFEGEVEYVQVPGSEGYLGVLAGHAALVTELAAGTLTVREPGGDERQLAGERRLLRGRRRPRHRAGRRGERGRGGGAQG